MPEYIEVLTRAKVPRNCGTCLYNRAYGCAHADRQKDYMKYLMYGAHCPSYWLNQHKYTPVDGRYD